ncbi:glutamate ligase domain-containing protein [Peterkaempfera bronchialis]|uniref:glutamate ligase domain-containing protein n=1 Tax=Peterkaempfera bronchialis TaxID=2126346 RepID=UPI003C2D2117
MLVVQPDSPPPVFATHGRSTPMTTTDPRPLVPVGRTIAVLGEMGELGEDTVTAHREIGRYAAEQGVDLLVAVGGALPKQLALAAAGHGVDTAVVADAETAAAYLESILQPGDKVLVKASRSAMLWQVCQRLLGQDVTGW